MTIATLEGLYRQSPSGHFKLISGWSSTFKIQFEFLVIRVSAIAANLQALVSGDNIVSS